MLSLGAGYLLTSIVGKSDYAEHALAIATAMAVLITMPAARRAQRVLGGALRGLGVGVAVGMGVAIGQIEAPPAGGDSLVAAAEFLGAVVSTTSATLGPGPAPAGQMLLAIATPTLQERALPVGFASRDLIAVLVPAVCCLGAGAVFALAAQKRRGGGVKGLNHKEH